MRVFKLRILNGGKHVWMFPLTKLVRSVGEGFRREKVVQTVTWLSDLRKKFGIRLMNKSVSVKCSVSPRRMAFLDIVLILFLSSAVS